MPVTCQHCESEFIVKLTKTMGIVRGSIYCPICGKKADPDFDMAKAVFGI
jgi:hypothetical protein